MRAGSPWYSRGARCRSRAAAEPRPFLVAGLTPSLLHTRPGCASLRAVEQTPKRTRGPATRLFRRAQPSEAEQQRRNRVIFWVDDLIIAANNVWKREQGVHIRVR